MVEQKNDLIKDTLIDELTENKMHIDLSTIKILLDNNAKFNEKSIDNACHNYDEDLLTLLIESNNKINISDSTINYIIIYNQKNSFKIIVENDSYDFNKHHFDLLCQYGNLYMLELLLDYLAKKNLVNKELISSGITVSSNYSNKEVLQFLLQYKKRKKNIKNTKKFSK